MQGNFPLVSVIIPTYNRGYIIRRTIKSVINQSYDNIEIIVVDDGSTDNTEEEIRLIKQESHRKIKYVKLTNNSNGAVARNRGIEEAEGEYISFLDSDDYWDTTKIEKQYNYIINKVGVGNKNSNIVCYTQLIGDRGKVKCLMPRCGIHDNESVGEYLFKNNGLMQTSTLMLPTSLARRIKFDPSLKKHQDWDYCIKLEEHGATFLFLNEPLSYWDIGDRKDRVSNENDYKYSLEWVCQNRSKLTQKAYDAFLGKIVSVHAGRSGKKFYGIGLLLKGFIKKNISIKDLIITLIKITIPVNILYSFYNSGVIVKIKK